MRGLTRLAAVAAILGGAALAVPAQAAPAPMGGLPAEGAASSIEQVQFGGGWGGGYGGGYGGYGGGYGPRGYGYARPFYGPRPGWRRGGYGPRVVCRIRRTYYGPQRVCARRW